MNSVVVAALTIASVLTTSRVARAQSTDVAAEGTFSIVARDPGTGELGIAVQSKALATGSRTITIKGGVAVVAHQSESNPMYGTLGLELLSAGMSPQQALELMLRSDESRDRRQVAILDASGRPPHGRGLVHWTGKATSAAATFVRKAIS